MHNDWSQDIYTKTYRFAAYAHHGQTLPGMELPYIVHPTLVSIEVIAALRAKPGHDEDLAVKCALLHDVIEDTQTTYQQVQEAFGTAIADGVLALSKDKELPKHLQMQDSLQRIRQQPKEVWMVKLADRISNLRSPPPHWTKEKTRRYRKEAIEIHDALAEASEFLSTRLLQKIEDYQVYTT